ncbi:2-oxo-4-hydroxy-4-carboxy-5-ureidoimidazoline decarboxylase [Nocardioides sp.]|uniref:2-oxo-4-hydroxy-4-carboxy-5-ureidoimidazoline decarboxylase n=1 Tax=Nocardioides sp. TaxID=35761 RepID=UPI002736AFA2|nr:2-oxo-4-hydroxy-4-carboxy-5-ureidoimidazoline decarboxylase [Nocardioides sp.]MDP3891313.1 2-oxo-4-hydroxy-4-carboxy-5-ureidoimidazoline decarboxylase [Nocardioides sp.]
MKFTRRSTAPRPAVLPVDEVLPAGKLAVYGLQHVLTFYAGAAIVPLLVAGALGLSGPQLAFLINANLFTCGIATLIQTIGFWKIGVRLPVVQGTTFVAVGPMIAIGLSSGGGVPGLLEIYGAVIIAGIFAFLIAPYFAKLVRFFPPIVTGTVITSIGIVLLPVAALEAGGGDPGAEDFGSLPNLALAAATLLLILFMYRFFRGFAATIAVLLGLVAGTGLAALAGRTDFGGIGESSWVGVITPFHFGLPTFGLAAITSMLIVMLITAVEMTGDTLAVGEIVRKKVGPDGIARAIRSGGLSTAIGGTLNSFPLTSYSANAGLVRLTGVRSRFVVAAAGVMMLIIGIVPKTGAVVAAIPHPVLGGAGLVLFGAVGVVGIQILSRADLTNQRNVVILATSLGFALIPVGFPDFYAALPEAAQMIFASGITMAALSAIVLNLVFNEFRRKLADPADEAAPPPPRLDVAAANALSSDEFVRRFGTVFQGGDWIAEQAAEQRPFADPAELRDALHRPLFDVPSEVQTDLIRSYPNLAGEALATKLLGTHSLRDQYGAGLHRLEPDQSSTLAGINTAYHAKFGFPLVICVRGKSQDEVIEIAESRLHNSPAQERATALVEITRIANARLGDLIDDPATRAEEIPSVAPHGSR